MQSGKEGFMSRTRWIAASAFAVATVVTGGGVTFAQRSSLGPPAFAGDLSTAQLVEVRDTSSGQVLLHGALATKKDTPKEMEREADLASPDGRPAKGEFELEIERKDGVVTETEIEVETEKLPAGLNCEVFLDGRAIGTLVTSKKGKGELKLEWKVTPGR
jgi:hypothetical protein